MDRFSIAVVEDDESFRDALEVLFQSAGHPVLPYTSGEEFMQSGCIADIGCLVTDFGLTGMNGIELLRAAHALRPDLSVVLITAIPEPSILSRALAAGAYRAFSKPLDSGELLGAIRSIR